ncbi:uncharacterized protein L199_007105 [Kwoniella botswanensis]|uniref:uncharacterized protein n=1 Tax=Kwoniella botswanensis TaxID=1268659 RepID=UPI00315DF2D5
MANIGARGRGRGGGINRTPAPGTVRSTRDDNGGVQATGGVHTYETTYTSTFRTNGNSNESSLPGSEFGSSPNFSQEGFGQFGSFPDMPPMPRCAFTSMNNLMDHFGGSGGFGAFGSFGDDIPNPSDEMNVSSGGSGVSQSPQSQPAQGKHHEDKTMANNTTSGSETASDVAEGTRSRTLSPEKEAKSSEQGPASTAAATEASTSGRSMQPTVEDDLEDWEEL